MDFEPQLDDEYEDDEYEEEYENDENRDYIDEDDDWCWNKYDNSYIKVL